eukprot:scaffold107049_cov28-Tisochrysis_lutea.AAC.3
MPGQAEAACVLASAPTTLPARGTADALNAQLSTGGERAQGRQREQESEGSLIRRLVDSMGASGVTALAWLSIPRSAREQRRGWRGGRRGGAGRSEPADRSAAARRTRAVGGGSHRPPRLPPLPPLPPSLRPLLK